MHTTHTTFPDGLEVFYFANHQTEHHHPGGRKEIIFPDGTVKNVSLPFPRPLATARFFLFFIFLKLNEIYPTGEEENIFPDGTIQKIVPQTGERVIIFKDGQKVLFIYLFKIILLFKILIYLIVGGVYGRWS